MKTQASEFLLALGEFALAKQKAVNETKKEIEREGKALGAAYIFTGTSCVFQDENDMDIRDKNGAAVCSYAYNRYRRSVDARGFCANWSKEKGWY